MSPEERDNIVKAAEGELSNIIAKHDGLELAHAIDRWQVNYCEKYQDLAHGFRSTASIARQMQSKNPPGAASQIVIGDGNVVQSGNQQLANSQNVDADISVDSRPPQPKASVPWGTIGIFVASFLIAVTWFVPVPRWLPFSLTIAAGVTGLVQWLAFRARTWEFRIRVVRLTKRGRRGGGASISICARKLLTLKWDESDGCSKKTPYFITRLVMYIFLECLMFHVVRNSVLRCSKQRVKGFIICYYCTWIEG